MQIQGLLAFCMLSYINITTIGPMLMFVYDQELSLQLIQQYRLGKCHV